MNRCAHHCSKKTSAHAKAAGQATAARGPGQQRGCMLFAHVCCIARANFDNWKGCCRWRWSPCDATCCRCPRAAGPRLLCSDCSCARERHHLARHHVAALKRGRPTAWLLLSAKEWCPLSSELAGFGRKPCSCPIAAISGSRCSDDAGTGVCLRPLTWVCRSTSQTRVASSRRTKFLSVSDE